MSGAHGEVQVLRGAEPGPSLPLVENGGSASAIVWPGTGATLRSMHRIELSGGGRTVTLRHPMEAVYYVVSGQGTVQDPAEGSDDQPLVEGSMVHIEPGTAYRFRAGDNGMLLIGGPCPADPALYPQGA
jgi:quercetin dioxygenase-like cupin family protein